MKFHFFRTEFSSTSQASEEHDLTLFTSDEKKCFNTSEIRMKKEFNPSANENPLKFNITLNPVEKDLDFDGKLGRLVSGDRKSRVKRMSIPFEQGKLKVIFLVLISENSFENKNENEYIRVFLIFLCDIIS